MSITVFKKDYVDGGAALFIPEDMNHMAASSRFRYSEHRLQRRRSISDRIRRLLVGHGPSLTKGGQEHVCLSMIRAELDIAFV
jgi:hypothetical protein